MPDEKKNRNRDSSICDEASGKTSDEKKTWGEVKERMETQGEDLQTAWVNRHRSQSWGIFIAAGLVSTAIAALTAGSALALTCPEGEELITPSTGEPYCQPTEPLTFPGAHEGDAGDIRANKDDDRGSGRLENSDREGSSDEFRGSGR